MEPLHKCSLVVMDTLQSLQDVDSSVLDAPESLIPAVDLQPFQELLDRDRGLSLKGIALPKTSLNRDDPGQIASICPYALPGLLSLDKLLDNYCLHILKAINFPHSGNKYSGSLLYHLDFPQLHLIECITDHLEVYLLSQEFAEIFLHGYGVLLLSEPLSLLFG